MMKEIPGLNGLYLASNAGQIFSVRSNRYLKPCRAPNGYLIVNMSINGRIFKGSVHGFVAAAFHGKRPSGLQTSHVNGNQIDNRPENLRYVSATENNRQKIAHGTIARGEDTKASRLTEKQVRRIRRECTVRSKTGKNASFFANLFGVSVSAVCRAAAGSTWTHVNGPSGS